MHSIPNSILDRSINSITFFLTFSVPFLNLNMRFVIFNKKCSLSFVELCTLTPSFFSDHSKQPQLPFMKVTFGFFIRITLCLLVLICICHFEAYLLSLERGPFGALPNIFVIKMHIFMSLAYWITLLLNFSLFIN